MFFRHRQEGRLEILRQLQWQIVPNSRNGLNNVQESKSSLLPSSQSAPLPELSNASFLQQVPPPIPEMSTRDTAHRSRRLKVRFLHHKQCRNKTHSFSKAADRRSAIR